MLQAHRVSCFMFRVESSMLEPVLRYIENRTMNYLPCVFDGIIFRLT